MPDQASEDDDPSGPRAPLAPPGAGLARLLTAAASLPFLSIWPGRRPSRGAPAPVEEPLPIEARPSPAEARAMRNFWWDGFFANVPETIILQYLALYALAFGASTAEIGVQASLISLMAALAFFPGARLAELWGRRKAIVVLFGGTMSRLAILSLAVLPFVFDGHTVVYLIIVFGALRALFTNLAMPAWTSLTSDIVPVGLRARFLSWRNIGMALAALAAAPLAGLLIRRLDFPEDWQTVWFIAFAMGMVSTFFFARIPELPWRRPEKGGAAAPSLRADRNFVTYCATALMWNLSIYVVAPFFNVYLVKELGASVVWVGVLAAVSSLAGIVGQLAFGRAGDRRGARWLIIVSGLWLPLLPWAWWFAGAPWHIIFINGAGGFLWAGYLLGNFTLLLHLSPEEWRPRYTAAYQSMVFLAAFVGPLVGGVIAEAYGIKPLFLISGAGRIVALYAFMRLVKEGPAPSLRPAVAEAGATP